MSRLVIPMYNADDDDDDSGDEGSPVNIIGEPAQQRGGSENFIPANTFTGEKPGFAYRDGVMGKGYYRSQAVQAVVQPKTQVVAPTQVDAPMSSKDLYALLKSKEKEDEKNTGNRIPMHDDDEDDDDPKPVPAKAKSSSFGKVVGMISSSVSKRSPSEDSSNRPVQQQGGARVQPVSFVPQQAVPQTAVQPTHVAAAQPTHVAAVQPTHVAAVQPTHVAAVQPTHVVAAQPTHVAAVQPTHVVAAVQPTPTVAAVQPQKASANRKNDERLNAVCEDVGLSLPSSDFKIPSFNRATRCGNLIFTSAHGPQLPNGVVRGRVGDELSMEKAQIAAGLAAMSLLKTLKTECNNSLNSISRIVRIDAQVSCESSTSELYDIFDLATHVFTEVFGSSPTISISGVRTLPDQSAVQLSAIVEVD